MNKVLPYLIFSLLLISTEIVQAQEQVTLRERAEKYHTGYAYQQAANIYLKLVDTSSPKLADLEKLADSYQKLNDYEAAENWYARVIEQPGSNAENLLKYGKVLKSNARYKEAKKVLQQYAKLSGKNESLINEIAGCDSALIWLAKPTPHKISNEKAINTANAEFGLFPTSSKVYYVGTPSNNSSGKKDQKLPTPFLKIFSTGLKNFQLQNNPTLENNIFNDLTYHVGPIITNRAEDVIFVTKTYDGRAGEVSKENKIDFNTKNLELLIYTLKDGNYHVAPFPYNDVKKYSVGHAALSPDEQTLYFVSDMPGGLGGKDLWYSTKDGSSWSQPKNAGPTVNSAGDEMFPFVSNAGILYYASNGFPGMGGLDVFYSVGEKENWSKPINLRYPINSPADDFSFTIDKSGTFGYLSSNRKGGMGGDDIYSFNLPKVDIILSLQGLAIDRKTQKALDDVTVTLYDTNRNIISQLNSKLDGTFKFHLDKETEYTLVGRKNRFYSDSTTISTKGVSKSNTFNTTLSLDSLFEIGKMITLKNINYDFDKDKIRADARQILDELVRVMRDNPSLKVELKSHTDSRGSASYNLNLSQRRANSVVNYLVDKGISRARLNAKGYGETQLLNKCSGEVKCSETDHQLNRRTEFVVTSY